MSTIMKTFIRKLKDLFVSCRNFIERKTGIKTLKHKNNSKTHKPKGNTHTFHILEVHTSGGRVSKMPLSVVIIQMELTFDCGYLCRPTVCRHGLLTWFASVFPINIKLA